VIADPDNDSSKPAVGPSGDDSKEAPPEDFKATADTNSRIFSSYMHVRIPSSPSLAKFLARYFENMRFLYIVAFMKDCFASLAEDVHRLEIPGEGTNNEQDANEEVKEAELSNSLTPEAPPTF
jgi:hypothetical protein